ncbi:EAL domain-containing protein [Kyrpidia spormannii]|uniref:hypothetical protein n=1 Tax=Kyrpidia spormannii TaxID=2055160 RepID=UPI0012FFEC4F|nr:hypothetical protein [Kyrpidia spormannii]
METGAVRMGVRRAGRGAAEVGVDEEAVQRRELERFIRDRNMVTLFQPIIPLADGETIGFEVLNRPPLSSSFANAEAFYRYVGQSTQVFVVERSCRDMALCRFAEQVGRSETCRMPCSSSTSIPM